MTEAQKIDELATIDAKEDFIALDKRLEEIKRKIQDFTISDRKGFLFDLTLLDIGFLLGLNVRPRLRWLFKPLGIGTGFLLGALIFKEIADEKAIDKKKIQTVEWDKPEPKLEHEAKK